MVRRRSRRSNLPKKQRLLRGVYLERIEGLTLTADPSDNQEGFVPYS